MKKFWMVSLAFCLTLAAAAQPGRAVFSNGVIHTATRDAFSGYLVTEGGRIVEVGEGTAPAGETVDLQGGHLYPGLIDADTQMGLVEVESLRATSDQAEVGEINPNLRAAVGYRAESVTIPVARSQGVLTAGVNPTGGLLSGQGSVMRLWGWTWEEATVVPAWCMSLDWPDMKLPSEKNEEASSEAVGELGRHLFSLQEAWQQARVYSQGAGDVKWEALKPYADGARPVLVRADGKQEIAAALDWAEAEKAKLVLVCGRDVHLFAQRLAKRKIPVIYSSLNAVNPRPEESVSLHHRTPALLRQAGVVVALSPSGLAFDVRELRDLAGKAVGNGLSELEALRSVTLSPAEILGVEKRLGSLEVGKEATLVLADGDLLETTTRVLRAWGAGVELSLQDRQKELYERYRARPRAR